MNTISDAEMYVMFVEWAEENWSDRRLDYTFVDPLNRQSGFASAKTQTAFSAWRRAFIRVCEMAEGIALGKAEGAE